MGAWSRFMSWLRPAEVQRATQNLTLDEFQRLLADAAELGIAQTASSWGREEHLPSEFESVVQSAYKRSGVVFACELARTMVFGQTRFAYQRFRRGRPDEYFRTPDLARLERPRPGETTRKLLVRMLLDADLGGTGIVTRRPSGEVRRVRPDWCTLVVGSPNDPMMVGDDLDAELVGVMYEPPNARAELLLAEDVAIFAPIPDPTGWFRGVPWLTPVLREMQSDLAATEHKLAFFKNGATPNLVVSFEPTMTVDQVKEFKEKLEAEHRGARNAYKTLYLLGAKASPVGADFQAMDFKQISGLSETRIAAAAGVHPVILGLSEGLQGSSLNAGNYGQVRRRFADMTIAPLWEEAAATLEHLFPPPDDSSRLWYDARDVPFLREDRADVAKIQADQAVAIRQLVDAGYKPDTVVAAIDGEDMTVLEHSGLYSVQLQPPGPGQQPATMTDAPEEASAEEPPASEGQA
ncbi:MAG TPA: phage portal protein [Micromonosporaceae bacterium]